MTMEIVTVYEGLIQGRSSKERWMEGESIGLVNDGSPGGAVRWSNGLLESKEAVGPQMKHRRKSSREDRRSKRVLLLAMPIPVHLE